MNLKKSVFIIFAALMLSVSLFGCDGNQTTNHQQSQSVASANVSAQEVADNVKASVTLEDMQAMTETDLSAMYGIDLDDVAEFAGEMDSTGLRTDEFLIVLAKDSQSADRILAKMNSRKTQRMNESKNYNPQGYANAQKAPVAKKGNYVYLFISDSADDMVAAFEQIVP